MRSPGVGWMDDLRARLSLAEIVRKSVRASEVVDSQCVRIKGERYHLTTKQHRRRRSSSSAYSTLDSPREVSSYTRVHEHAMMT